MLQCRLCLKFAENTLDIFDKNLQVSTVIERHFWFKVKKDDLYSKNICSACWKQVSDFDKFYLKIQQAQGLDYHGVFTRIPLQNLKSELNESNNNLPIEQMHNFGEFDFTVKRKGGDLERIHINLNKSLKKEHVDLPAVQDIKQEPEDPIEIISIKNQDDVAKPDTSVAELLGEEDNRKLDNIVPIDVNYLVKQEEPWEEDEIKSNKSQCKTEMPPLPSLDNVEKMLLPLIDIKKLPFPFVENIKKETLPLAENIQDETPEPEKTEIYSERLSKIKALNHIANHAAVKSDDEDEDEQQPTTSEATKQKKKVLQYESDFQIDDSSTDSYDSQVTVKNENVPEYLRKYSCDGPEERDVKLDMENGKRPYACQTCGKSFSHARILERHNGTHTKSFACDKCSKRYARADILKRHKQTHHRPAEANSKTQRTKGSLTYNHKCQHCDKAYVNRPALQDHIYLKHISEDMKKFQCKKCPKKFYNASLLYRHKIYHSAPEAPKEFKCEHCSKSFSEAYSLRKHVNGYHSGQVFACEECPKKFIYAYLLRRHMGAHKRFACDKCSKTFTRALNLRKHKEEMH